MHRLPRRPSPPAVVACLALFFALSGTSLADVAQVLPRNSVGPAQLRTNAVTSLKVRNGTLKVVDLAPGARATLRGRTGPSGPAGPKGEKGDKGDRGEQGTAGAPGVSGYEIVTEATDAVNTQTRMGSVTCPTGKRALGGGVVTNTTNANVGPYIAWSRPTTNGQGWSALTLRQANGSWTMTIHVICATVS